MHRRSLLLLPAVWPMASMAAQVAAAPSARGSKLLVVFLRGGYDCANVLVPYASDFYYQSRPTIAVPRPGEQNGAVRLDDQWALHPALASALAPLLQARQVAFVPFAGTDDLSRSHFETQDTIELGQPLAGHRDYRSGMLNRLEAVLGGGARPMAFTAQLPLSMQGSVGIPNMALSVVGKPGVSAQLSTEISRMYQGTSLAAPVSKGFAVRDQVYDAVRTEMQAADRGAMAPRGFGVVAHRMAELMRDDYDLGFVDVGGWDTHVGEGAAGGGYLAARLGELGTGLSSFASSMGPTWRHTLVVVVSEFGRTFRENGNHGTDHGHGTVYWILGGAVAAQAGGRVIGEQAAVSQAGLFQNRDFPVLTDYRSLLGGLFQRLYGLSAGQTGSVFAQARPMDLGLI